MRGRPRALAHAHTKNDFTNAHMDREVNPYGMQYQHPGPPPNYPPPRRSGVGWWIAGCGCLAIIGVFVIGFIVLLAIGASLSSGDSSRPQTSSQHPVDPETEEQLQLFEAERSRFYELAAPLEGNPVAPLVADVRWFQQLEESVDEGAMTYSGDYLVSTAKTLREELEQRIAAAELTRVNASGTLMEGIVDTATNGFVDVQWDAATACTSAEEEDESITTACVKDNLNIHFLADSEYDSDWERLITTAHELAHIYKRADKARFDDGTSDAERLVDQGLFQGSDESMADCYALTYYGEWTLSDGYAEIGYGYVCNESERQAIREWAATINAPMP